MADKWIQNAVSKMKKKGTVGSFGKEAGKAGMSTGSFANKVLGPNSKASAATKKKAQFAKNVAK